MNVSLPAPLKRWVDETARKGDFGTASEYIRHVLRNERRRQLREETDSLLLEGLDSGEWRPWAAGAAGLYVAFRLAEIRQLRKMNRALLAGAR